MQNENLQKKYFMHTQLKIHRLTTKSLNTQNGHLEPWCSRYNVFARAYIFTIYPRNKLAGKLNH